MQSQQALKQAVQEQLDLILKIEEERKILKRENKKLKEQHQKMLNIVKKYNIDKLDACTQTDPEEPSQVEEQKQEVEKVEMKSQHTQADIEPPSQNTSKLYQAYQLLKKPPPTHSVCHRCQQNKMNEANKQKPKSSKNINTNDKQVGNQIVKMAKEIALLKRQITQCQKNNKTKDKQLREVKRCLEVKSQALQKSRKDFNQLSQVFNTDKYKSVKLMGEELTQTKIKLAVLQQQSNYSTDLRRTLQEVTVQYQNYRQDRQYRIQSLLHELKQKDSRCDDLSKQMQTIRLELSRI